MFKKLFGLSFIFILIDQLIKGMVSIFMNLNSSIVIIEDFFNLTYVQNTGAAFSILEGNRLFLILAGFVGLNLIYFFLIKNKELKKLEIIIYSILIAGIIGNMVDRIMFGYVIDYLDFNIFGYNFAIFNLADTYIVVSAIIIFIMEVKDEINSRRRIKREN